MKLETVSLKRSQHLTERWVQDRIAEDPTILGLGDLILKDKERMQPGAGRLDILLQDPESLKRYEVEIQLGSTDERGSTPKSRTVWKGLKTSDPV